MKKENQWQHGTRNFGLPALPPDMKGRHGCKLDRMTFDHPLGEEICAVYMEEPDFVDKFRAVHPFNLMAHTGLVASWHRSIYCMADRCTLPARSISRAISQSEPYRDPSPRCVSRKSKPFQAAGD
jgi:hypothetical protein